MKKEEFIHLISPLVQKENTKRGNPLFSSVVIAQACLESGYGTSSLMMKANAVFGIKATSSWKGRVYNSQTKECYDGVNYTNINASFRAYNNLEDSISDYFNLIINLPRYKKAIHSPSPKACITAIKEGGYATDPKYIDKIMGIIETNHLTKYDGLCETSNKSNEEIANEVIKGLWGNGEERKNRLTSSGYNYSEVQRVVNNLLKKKSNEEIANEVIKGLWGNGEERKNRLTQAGYNYSEVQKLVNRKLKK